MKTIYTKIAAAVALYIGGMAVYAGLPVLLGRNPGYNVINWLPVYNYTFGLLTVLITAVLLWTNHRLARPAAITTFVIHGAVLLILSTAYQGIVAAPSLRAMTIRLATWLIILGLLFLQRRKDQVVSVRKEDRSYAPTPR